MRSISLIALPYDSGRFEERMGRGPRALFESGLVEELEHRRFEVTIETVRLTERFQTEASALVELQRQAAPLLRKAISRGSRPVVFSGNCSPAAVSATAALGCASTGVIWFDAHGDFNTPETSPSGFLDGMALSILTGGCWPKLAERLDGFESVPMENVIQVGARDLDPAEEIQLHRSPVARIASDNLSELCNAIDNLLGRVRQVYVHLDLDVLDLSEGSANSYACAGGLTVDDLCRALELIGARTRIAVGSITSYDPEVDRDGRIARAVPRLVELLSR